MIIITQGYTQAPTPTPHQPSKEQQAWEKLDPAHVLEMLRAYQDDGTIKSAQKLLEEQEEAARLADLEAKLGAQDQAVMDKLMQAITARREREAIALYHELESRTLRTSTARALTHVFGAALALDAA